MLQLRKLAGEILDWKFGCFKLRLADGAWYKTDFFVVLADGEIQCHETKGFMREAARVRLNVAADLYPFTFILVKRVNGQWTKEKV